MENPGRHRQSIFSKGPKHIQKTQNHMTSNFFTKEEVYDILDNAGNKLGIDVITYSVMKVVNTKNLTCSDTYSVTVKHRLLVNGINWDASTNYQSTGFNNYPVLVNVQTGITASSQPTQEVLLKRIFPKTINASVEQSTNISTGSSSSQTNQSSSGSNSSNVNTFGVDLSAGWFVDGPVASIGVNYSHSWENGTSQSTSLANSNATNLQRATGNEMSVKDWSAYSSVKNFNNTSNEFIGEYVQWNWGQTNPWNIFDFNENASGSNILLPQSVVANMLYYGAASQSGDSNILLPPSDLSLFGLDFTMASEWMVTFPNPLTSIESLTFQHDVSVASASHSMTVPGGGGQGSLIASLGSAYNNVLKQNQPLILSDYALIPLSNDQTTGIGFQANLFDISPATPSTNFKIRSRGNDLMVTGTGFLPTMSAVFPANYAGTGATMTVSFKVADINTQYAFVLKHWIGQNSGNIVLTCVINGNQTTVNVMDQEGQGSLNNINQLDLRNFDLKSANFHDYLVLGWNEITITVTPQNKTVASEYVLLALSIEG